MGGAREDIGEGGGKVEREGFKVVEEGLGEVFGDMFWGAGVDSAEGDGVGREGGGELGRGGLRGVDEMDE